MRVALVSLAIVGLIACRPSPSPGEGEGEGEGESACFDLDANTETVDDLPATFLAALDGWAARCNPEDTAAMRAVEPDTSYEAVVESAVGGANVTWRDQWRAWRLRDAGAVSFRSAGLSCLTELMSSTTCEFGRSAPE